MANYPFEAFRVEAGPVVASAPESARMEMEAPDTDPIVTAILADDPDGERARAALAASTPAEGAALLERLAQAAADAEPERATRWLVEAAALWSGAAGDAKRAARALRAAVDVSPTDDEALAQLTRLYRENGKHRPLARLLERRAELLLDEAGEETAALARAGEAFTTLGHLLRDPPLESPVEAIAAYGRAIATRAAPIEAFRAARALYLEAEQSADALPLFAMERERCADPAALVALYREEARARELAGDGAGASAVLRLAYKLTPDATGLAEDLWRSIRDRVAAGEPVLPEEKAEATAILATVAAKLEATALPAHDLAGLKLAFALAVRALEGAPRAAELVRQAEVLVGLGAERPLAVRHAEPALADLSAAEAAPLLERLESIAGPEEAIALHERAIDRATTAEGRAAAVGLATRAAVKHGSLDRIERFFAAITVHASEEPSLAALERATAEGDHRRGGTVLRGILAAALAHTEPDVIDGGRTRSALLRRASRIARRDLGDPDLAFEWLGDALFARLEGALEEGLAPLEHLTSGAAPGPVAIPVKAERLPTQPPPPPPLTVAPPKPAIAASPTSLTPPPVARVEVLASRGPRLPPLMPPVPRAPDLPQRPAPPPPSVRADALPVAPRPPTVPPAPAVPSPEATSAPRPLPPPSPRFDAPPPPSVRAEAGPARPAAPPPAPPPPPPPIVRVDAPAARASMPPPPPPPVPRLEVPATRPATLPPPVPPAATLNRPATIPPVLIRPPTVAPPPPAPPPPAAPADATPIASTPDTPPAAPVSPVVPAAAVAPATPAPSATAASPVTPEAPAATRPAGASSRRKVGKAPLMVMRDPFAPPPAIPARAASPPAAAPPGAIPKPAAPGVFPAPSLPEPRPPTPTPPSGPTRSRISGEELIADLFEAMHELDFCTDSIDAATFTLKLAMSKLASDAGVVHLYDIDRREFVVVHAAGPGASVLRGLRTADTDPLADEAMRTRGAIIVSSPAEDARTSGQRWGALRNATGSAVASIAVARAAQAGRFLGLVELVNLAAPDPETPGAFAAGDEHALSYIADRFAEFVAAHGVMLDDDG